MKKSDLENIDIKDLAGIISRQLTKNDIDAVLVGGACVSIYTKNDYLSFDLDYVSYTAVKEIKVCLEEIGFMQKAPNRFVNENCKFYIEFVSPPVAIGHEAPIKKYNKLKTAKGEITLLTATDCVKDRLAAYYHWNDPQSLEQALMVATKQKVNMKDIETWSRKENKLNEFKKFKQVLGAY